MLWVARINECGHQSRDISNIVAARGGYGVPKKGFHHTAKTRAMMSRSHRGIPLSPAHRQACSVAQYARTDDREWSTTHKPQVLPTAEDIAWAAGYLEGEGTFNWQKVAVYQVNREPQDRMLRLFGGSVYPSSRVSGRQPGFIWQVCGARSRALMRLVRPRMSARRRAQIDIALVYVPKSVRILRSA